MQQKYLLSEEKRRPKSVTRIIAYTIVGVLSFILTYMIVCITGFIFLVWFTINGDIKPLLGVFCNATKPLYNVLVETKLKSYTPDKQFIKEKD
jgi:hypothetical protein